MSPHPKLVLYGDSIMEQWRQTSMGLPIGKKSQELQPVEGNLEMLRSSFIERYGPTIVMAINGETSGNLLWRLQNGAVPQMVPQAIVLNIGINDLINNINFLGYKLPKERRTTSNIINYFVDHCTEKTEKELLMPEKKLRSHRWTTCPKTSEAFKVAIAQNVYVGIKAVIAELWGRCRAPIVLTSLFPLDQRWPKNLFAQVVPFINGFLAELASSSGGALSYVDCSFVVLTEDWLNINHTLMPDFFHPGPEAMAGWAECLKPTLDRLTSCHV